MKRFSAGIALTVAGTDVDEIVVGGLGVQREVAVAEDLLIVSWALFERDCWKNSKAR